MTHLAYRVEIRPLSEEEWGGYLAVVLDLPGCMADGATAEEGIAELHDAIAAWKERAQAMGREIPEPHFEQRRFG
jgi:predicted RNase H-like HicB family nuclease